MITYKDYTGIFEFDATREIFHGEVIGISDVVTFQGKRVPELKAALQDSVEDYLAFCAELGKEPAKPFSGRFSVRLDPRLHAEVAQAAAREHASMNAWIAKVLKGAVQGARQRKPA